VRPKRVDYGFEFVVFEIGEVIELFLAVEHFHQPRAHSAQFAL